MPKINNTQGIAVILLVFVLSMAMLVVGKSLITRNLDRLNQVYLFKTRQKANYLTLACAQNALRRLQLDSSYLASTQNIALPGGNCLLTISADGDERIVEAKGQVGESYQQITARLRLTSNKLELIEWAEN